MLSRNPFVLYPFWFVELPLNYPNSTITGWQVGIWADTGEIAYSHPTGILGTQPDIENTAETLNIENAQLSHYIIIATVTIAIATVTVMVIFKKRNR
ncbi:MAG: hypothetical protein QXX34_07820 [Candidatus Bathyarchaeia archaeon]